MATLLVGALVECCHGLVSRPGLDLHEVSSLVLTARTVCVSAVHVVPGRSAAQHVLDLLELGEGLVADPPGDVVDVGAGGAGESVAGQSFLTLENISTGRTE